MTSFENINFLLPGESLSSDGIGANNLDGQDAVIFKDFSSFHGGLLVQVDWHCRASSGPAAQTVLFALDWGDRKTFCQM